MSKKVSWTLSAAVSLAGCGYGDAVKQRVGLAPSAVEVEASAVREKVEREMRAAQEKTEREARLQAIRDADHLTSSWAARLASEADSPDVPSEPDPWGRTLRVEVEQDGFKEVISVISDGPDGTPGTADDVRHRRSRRNLSGSLYGFGPWPALAAGWTLCGALALVGTAAKGRHRRKSHPVLSGLAIVIIAPIVLVAYAFLFAGSMFAALLGGDGDGIEIGFDIFDIDLDLF
jgi:hypothetical protein